VVAVYQGQQLACWEFIDAYATNVPWGKTGRMRTGLILGKALPTYDPVPVPALPNLRNGCAVIDD